jgi:hypothetical protein
VLPLVGQNVPPGAGEAVRYITPNPKQQGSLSAARYDRYMLATTVDEALSFGATRDDIRYDFRKGFLQRVDLTPSSCLICGAPSTCADDLSGDSPRLGDENGAFVDVAQVGAIIREASDAPSLRQAMSPRLRDEWLPAVLKQAKTLERYETFVPVRKNQVPAGATIIHMACDLTIKRSGDKRARVFACELKGTRPPVASGEAGPHVPTHSSPAPGYTAVKLIVCHGAHYVYVLEKDDVNDAYLNGARRSTPIYAYFPAAWSCYLEVVYGPDRAAWPYDPAVHVAAIWGNIPGAVDAGAIWREAIHPVIVDLGYSSTPLNEALYVRLEPSGETSMLLLWTDDVIVSASPEVKNETFGAIQEKYPTKGRKIIGDDDADLLGADVVSDGVGGYYISMSTYEDKVLSRLEFGAANPSRTPLPHGWHADPSADPYVQLSGTPPHKFREPYVAIGLVSFLACVLRLDIAFGVSALATALVIWGPKHDAGLARTLRYLKGNRGKRLRFPARMMIDLRAYCDAGFANELHSVGSTGRARSRVGGLLQIGGVILWFFSARTRTTPTSTAEAELVALVRMLRGLVTLRATITVAFNKPSLQPTPVFEDNMAVILMLRRRVISGSGRHVRVAIGYILDVLDAGHAVVKFVPSKAQLADVLTKSLTKDDLDSVCGKLFA